MMSRRFRPAVLLRVRRLALARSVRLPAWRALALCWKSTPRPALAAHTTGPVRRLYQQFNAQFNMHVWQGAAAVKSGSPARESGAMPAIGRSSSIAREHVHHHNARWESLCSTVERFGRSAPDARAGIVEHRVSATVFEHRRSSEKMFVALAPGMRAHLADSCTAQGRSVPAMTDRQSAIAGARRSRSAPPSSATIAHAVLQRERDSAPLVWQRPAKPGVTPSAEADESTFAESHLATVPINANLAATAVGSHAQAQIRQFAQEAQRALLLDPALADRLADDVLRRVDKRLRIERERRGM